MASRGANTVSPAPALGTNQETGGTQGLNCPRLLTSDPDQYLPFPMGVTGTMSGWAGP